MISFSILILCVAILWAAIIIDSAITKGANHIAKAILMKNPDQNDSGPEYRT